MKGVFIAVLALAMAGCAHEVMLMERGGSMMGSGTVPATMMNSGEITISLNGEEYAGRWVFSKGGSYSLASMSGTSFGAGGARGGTAIGSGFSVNSSGNGNILAKSASGKGLRCVFDYSTTTRTGTGICQDDDGRLYDMQIS